MLVSEATIGGNLLGVIGPIAADMPPTRLILGNDLQKRSWLARLANGLAKFPTLGV